MKHIVWLVLLFSSFGFGQIGGGAKIGGGGGGAATPPTSGMQFWGRSDTLVCTGGCSGTNAVTQWTDKSPSVNNANSVTAGTYLASAVNSQPGVTFNGTSTQYNFVSSIPLTTASTMFVVLKSAQTTTATTLVSGNSQAISYNFPTPTKEQGVDATDIAAIGKGTAASDTAYHQMNYTYNGTTVVFRLGSVSDGSTALTQAITANEVSIGFDEQANTAFFNGVLVELIIYNRVLTGGEITTVESYLNTRYGI